MDPYTLFSKMIESFWEQLFRLDNELVGYLLNIHYGKIIYADIIIQASEKGKHLPKFQF